MQFNYISGINCIQKFYFKPKTLRYKAFFFNVDILAYFQLVPLCRGGNLQFRCQQLSASSFLVRFHCTYLLLSDRREPDNEALLRVCLPVCIRVTNRLYLLQLKNWHTAESDQELINLFKHNISILYTFMINFSSPITFHRPI